MDDIDEEDRHEREVKLAALVEEENRYKRISRVFGSEDGLTVAEWFLDLAGYWSSLLPDERSLGRFDLGRNFFNQLCLADISIGHALLERRRKRAESVRLKEKRMIEKGRE